MQILSFRREPVIRLFEVCQDEGIEGCWESVSARGREMEMPAADSG